MARTSGRRREVLRLVEASREPLRAADVASALDAPLSSVRFHLDSMVADGLLEGENLPVQGRGRPSMGYRATAAGHAEAHRALGRLATVLVEALDIVQGEPGAREAGRRWGQELAGEDRTAGALTTPRRDLMAMLRREGFEPRPARSGRDIDMRACPYLDLARGRPGIICALHDGAVQGYWETRGGEGSTRVLPFSGPHSCRVALS